MAKKKSNSGKKKRKNNKPVNGATGEKGGMPKVTTVDSSSVPENEPQQLPNDAVSKVGDSSIGMKEKEPRQRDEELTPTISNEMEETISDGNEGEVPATAIAEKSKSGPSEVADTDRMRESGQNIDDEGQTNDNKTNGGLLQQSEIAVDDEKKADGEETTTNNVDGTSNIDTDNRNLGDTDLLQMSESSPENETKKFDGEEDEDVDLLQMSDSPAIEMQSKFGDTEAQTTPGTTSNHLASDDNDLLNISRSPETANNETLKDDNDLLQISESPVEEEGAIFSEQKLTTVVDTTSNEQREERKPETSDSEGAKGSVKDHSVDNTEPLNDQAKNKSSSDEANEFGDFESSDNAKPSDPPPEQGDENSGTDDFGDFEGFGNEGPNRSEMPAEGDDRSSEAQTEKPVETKEDIENEGDETDQTLKLTEQGNMNISNVTEEESGDFESVNINKDAPTLPVQVGHIDKESTEVPDKDDCGKKVEVEINHESPGEPAEEANISSGKDFGSSDSTAVDTLAVTPVEEEEASFGDAIQDAARKIWSKKALSEQSMKDSTKSPETSEPSTNAESTNPEKKQTLNGAGVIEEGKVDEKVAFYEDLASGKSAEKTEEMIPNEGNPVDEAFAFFISALRKELGEQAENVADKSLLKFINWKPDIVRAAERFRSHLKWRLDNPFAFDEKPLLLSEDSKLFREAIIAPKDMVAKDGSAVLIVRLRKNDMSNSSAEDVCRTVFFTIDRMLERNETQKHGVTIILDLKGSKKKNFDAAVPEMLSKASGSFPLRIKSIYVLQAPWWFNRNCNLKSYLSEKLSTRIISIKDVSKLYDIVEKSRCLEEHGGELKFNAYEWAASQMKREHDGDYYSLKNCIQNWI